MSDLVMPKNEGRLDFLEESIRFVNENGGIMKTDEFVSKEQQAHPGMDTTSCYHKIVMARYFGLVLYNKYSSYYLKKRHRDRDQDKQRARSLGFHTVECHGQECFQQNPILSIRLRVPNQLLKDLKPESYFRGRFFFFFKE